MTLLFPTTDIFTGEISCKYKNITGYNKGCRCKDCTRHKCFLFNNIRYTVREIYDQIRNSHSCMDCGRDDVSHILQFHHLTDNENDFCPRDATSINQMVRELKKGVFLCPTCHILRHVNPETGLVSCHIPEFR